MAAANSLVGRAVALLDERRPAEAEPLARRALELLADAAAAGADVAAACLVLAAIRQDQGAFDDAEALCRRALTALDHHPALRARALGQLGDVLRARGDDVAAETALRGALELAETASGCAGADVAAAANNLAVLYKFTGRFDEAESLYRRALALVDDDDAITPTLWHNLGGLEHSRGHPEVGEAHARRGLEMRVQALGAEHPAVAADAAALGAMLDDLGRNDEAEACFRQAMAVFEARLGPDHPEMAVNANNLAAVEFRRGHLREAEALWRRSLAIKERAFGHVHPEVAATLTNLGVLAQSEGRRDEAEALWIRALTILEGRVTPDHPVRRAAEDNLAKVRDRRL